MAFTAGNPAHAVLDAEIELAKVEKGVGFSVLQFAVGGSFIPDGFGDRVAIEEFRGEVHISGKGGLAYLGVVHRVGREPALFHGHGHAKITEARIAFEVHVTPAQVEKIEELRLGGDLGFQFQLWLRERSNKSEERVLHAGIVHPVSQSDWAGHLNRMGHGKTVLLEVGLPDDKATAEYKLVVDHLERAVANRGRGDWEGVVAECRKALEAITKVIGDSSRELPLWKDRETWTKNERARRVLAHVLLFAHPAAHAGGAWEPVDAQAMMAMTAALARLITGPRP